MNFNKDNGICGFEKVVYERIILQTICKIAIQTSAIVLICNQCKPETNNLLSLELCYSYLCHITFIKKCFRDVIKICFVGGYNQNVNEWKNMNMCFGNKQMPSRVHY